MAISIWELGHDDADALALNHETITAHSGVSRTAVHNELKMLTQIGALRRDEWKRLVHYAINDDDEFWPFVRALGKRYPADDAHEAAPTNRRRDG